MKKIIIISILIFTCVYGYAEKIDINSGVEIDCKYVFPEYENVIVSIGVNNTVFFGEESGIGASFSVCMPVYGSNYQNLIGDGLESVGFSVLLGLGYKINFDNFKTIIIIGGNATTMYASNAVYSVKSLPLGVGVRMLNSFRIDESLDISVPVSFGYNYADLLVDDDLPFNQIWGNISLGLNLKI